MKERGQVIVRAVVLAALSATVGVSSARAQASSGVGVQPAFDALLQSLEMAQQRNANRSAIEAAAHRLENAIDVDGGARDNVVKAVHNILASLHDGSFDANASLQALHMLAPHAVLAHGTWHPGSLYPEPVGLSLHQKGEGDCVGISALKAFSTSKAGEDTLRRMVAHDPAGGFTVNFPGAPSRVFHLPEETLAQYGIGDPAAAAIIGALFQYFGLDPHHSSLPTNKVMELLAGELGQHARLADHKSSAADIERFLVRTAPGVGNNVAVVFGGEPGQGGNFSRGDGHAFAIVRIDLTSRTVLYTNPWNEENLHSIAISDLAAQAAGTSADFETVTF